MRRGRCADRDSFIDQFPARVCLGTSLYHAFIWPCCSSTCSLAPGLEGERRHLLRRWEDCFVPCECVRSIRSWTNNHAMCPPQ